MSTLPRLDVDGSRSSRRATAWASGLTPFSAWRAPSGARRPIWSRWWSSSAVKPGNVVARLTLGLPNRLTHQKGRSPVFWSQVGESTCSLPLARARGRTALGPRSPSSGGRRAPRAPTTRSTRRSSFRGADRARSRRAPSVRAMTCGRSASLRAGGARRSSGSSGPSG